MLCCQLVHQVTDFLLGRWSHAEAAALSASAEVNDLYLAEIWNVDLEKKYWLEKLYKPEMIFVQSDIQWAWSDHKFVNLTFNLTYQDQRNVTQHSQT